MITHVELICDGFETVTREPSSDDSWDRGETHTSWSVTGAKLASPAGGYHTVPYDGELKSGDTVFCLYAIYSTGDSFGRDEDGRLEFIDVFTDAEKANAAKEAFLGIDHVYINDAGKEVNIYRPWDGYFESLTSIHVEAFVL